MNRSKHLLLTPALGLTGALGHGCTAPPAEGTAAALVDATPAAAPEASPDELATNEPRPDAGIAGCPPAPGPVPDALGLDPFYARHVDARSIPIVGSATVSDAAFAVAWTIVRRMTWRVDVREALRRAGVRVAIMATSEVTTDIPEHAVLASAFPEIDWDAERRGLGPTPEIPVASVGEENLLGLDRDVYRGEAVLAHEWAHATLTLGLRSLSPSGGGADALAIAYASALESGLWVDTYATQSADEYFAEGAQIWFEVNGRADPPDGRHGAIATRDALRGRDPALAEQLDRAFLDAPPLSSAALAAVAAGTCLEDPAP